MARTDLEQLVYQMSADVKALERANKRAMADVEKSSGRMQKRYDQLGSELGRTFGHASIAAGAAFGAIVAYATKAASDANETANAFQVAFGKMTPEAEKFAKSYSSTVGRSLTETQANMAKTQLILTGVGVAAQDALGMTEQIQRRAVDIGSLWNVKDAEAYQAIISGISGEAEPLKKFGVALNEAAVKAELLRLGFKGNAADASEAAKATARFNIIMRATTGAENDAIRTKDSLANRAKAVQAEFEKAAVTLGQNFLPVATQVAQKATVLLEEFNKLPDSVKLGGLAFLGLVAASGPLVATIKLLGDLIKAAGAARVAIMAIPGAGAVAAAGAPAAAVAATVSLKGDTGPVSRQAILNERLKDEVAAKKKIAEYEAKSGDAAARKLAFWKRNLAVAQEEIRTIRAQERAERISANRLAQRKKAPQAGILTGPTQFTLPEGLKSPVGKSSGGSGKKKATIDLTTKTVEVDEDTVFDLLNNLGGVRNAIKLPDSNPEGFVSAEDRAAAVGEGLDRARMETQAFWADTIEGGLWAAFEEGGPGVARYFARRLAAETIHNLAAGLAKSLTGDGKGGALGDVGKFFAGFFATGGTIPAGQWGVVNDGGPEAVRAKPGGGIEVMNNRALTALSGLNQRVSPQVVYRDRIVKIVTEASPYFDARVEAVATPGAIQSARAGSEAGAARATAAARQAARHRLPGR